MQIKDFYLDLREWPQYARKNWNVWLLESEAFKAPLKFEFTFDLEDIAKLKRIEESCRDYYDRILKKESTFNNIIDWIIEKEKMIENSYKRLEEISAKYDLLLKQIKEKENIIKEKELQENNKIWELNKQLKLLENRINLPLPQKIYINQWDEFVSWDELYICSPYKLPWWDYVIIEQYEYEPQNEYVMNSDEIQFKWVRIENEYFPCIQLKWSNAIDKPVSKVRLNILFFQI